MSLHGLSAGCVADDGLILTDGTSLLLRPLSADDRAGVAALFARLTPESRYRRFLSPKHELTPRELTYLTEIDHLNHQAFAAVDRRDGSIAGVGRYVHDAGRAGVADVAVEVADELQGLGIGTALTRRVVRCARANGFVLLTATALWENRPARALLRRLGFHARGSDGGVIELELELDQCRVALPALRHEAFRSHHRRLRSAPPGRRGKPDQPASSPNTALNIALHAR